MPIQELRFAWSIVVVLLFVVLLPWFSVPWLVLGAVPWLAGIAALAPQRRGCEAAAVLGALPSAHAAVGALAILVAALFLTSFVFSPAAALYLGVWIAAAFLLIASRGRTALLRKLLLGVAVASVAAIIGLGGAEALFHTPSLAWKLGTFQERIAWRQRYDKLWEGNVFGFRSPYETIARRAGVKRIFATGDSYTRGHKIPETDSIWPARLERELRQAYPPYGFEVINSGQDGWTLGNQAELLRRLGWQFNPDLVVIQYGLGGVLPSRPDFRHGGKELVYRSWQPLPLHFLSGAVGSSALLSVIEHRLAFLNRTEGLFALYKDGQVGWEQAKAALREIGDSSRARRTPVVLMIFPDLVRGEHSAGSYPYRPIVDRVFRAAQEAGLHVLDLVPIFAATGGDWRRWWAVPYESYPNSAAQAIAAQALAEYVVENGWVAPSSPNPLISSRGRATKH